MQKIYFFSFCETFWERFFFSKLFIQFLQQFLDFGNGANQRFDFFRSVWKITKINEKNNAEKRNFRSQRMEQTLFHVFIFLLSVLTRLILNVFHKCKISFLISQQKLPLFLVGAAPSSKSLNSFFLQSISFFWKKCLISNSLY